MSKVLVVGSSKRTRGGITSVIKAHAAGPQWQEYHCHWVQTHCDGSNIRKIWYLVTAIIDFIIRLPFYDLVHLHPSGYGSAKRKYIFAKLAVLFKKKIVVQLHTCNSSLSFLSHERKTYEFLFNKSEYILVLSSGCRNEIIESLGIKPEKVIVFYNPCPVVDQKHEKECKRPYVLFAGTIIPLKGYHDLINAFGKISEKYPEWDLVLAGNGEIEKAKNMAVDLGISTKVHFTGWVGGLEKDKLFADAAIFCLPSYTEGFPMAVLDAWAYGVPVITTPVGGMPDVAVDGENMLLFNPGDVVTLSKQLERMISDSELRNKIGLASMEFAKHQFNRSFLCKQLSEIYKSSLNES